MADIMVGSVAVGIVPSAVGFAEKLRAAIVPDAAKIGEQAAQAITDALQAKLDEFKGVVSVEADTAPALDEIDDVRKEAEKPAVMPVVVEAGGAGAKDTSEKTLGTDAELDAAGAESGAALTGGFSKETKKGLNDVGKKAAESVAAIVAGSVYEGIKMQHSADILSAAEKNKGISIAANKPVIDAQIKSLAQYGLTAEDVNSGLTQLINTGTPFNQSLQTQALAAKVAAATGKDYTAVLASFVKGGGTAARMIKQLGVSQVTGKDQATAMAAASTFLADRIQQEGGVAAIARQQHLSLAQATRLATEAAGESYKGQEKLAASSLTTSSAMTLLQQAQGGSATALKKLTTLGITQKQLQDMITQSTSGSIAAYNKLGIEVMPKTNTMTENLNQSTKILSSMYGGEAAAATQSFGMRVKAVRAELTNVSGAIGEKVLPDLTKLMKLLANPAVIVAALAITGIIAAIWLFVKAVEFAGKVQSAFSAVGKKLAQMIGKEVVPAIGEQAGGTEALTAAIAEQQVQIDALTAQLALQTGGTEAATAATEELNVAWYANPIGIVILAIVALVAIMVVLYLKVKVVREIFQTAFRDIKAIVVDVFDWVKDHWKLLLAILGGPIGLAVALIASHFSDIEKVVKTAFDWISTNWAKIYDAISGPFIKAFDFVKKAFTKFYDDVIKPVIGTISKVLSWLGLGSTKGVSGPGGTSKGTPGAPPILPAPKPDAAAAAAAAKAAQKAAGIGGLSDFAAEKTTPAELAAAAATVPLTAVQKTAVTAAATAAKTGSSAATLALTSSDTTSSMALKAQEAAALAKAAASGIAAHDTTAEKDTAANNIRISFQKRIDAAKMAELVKRNALRLALLQKEEQLYPAKAAQYAAQIAAFKVQDATQRAALAKQNAITLSALQAKSSATVAAATAAATATNVPDFLTGPLGSASIGLLPGTSSTTSGVPTLGSAVGATSPMNTGPGTSSLSGGASVSSAASAAASSASSTSSWETTVADRLADILQATNRVGNDVGKALNGQGRTSAQRAARMTSTRGR